MASVPLNVLRHVKRDNRETLPYAGALRLYKTTSAPSHGVIVSIIIYAEQNSFVLTVYQRQ